MESTNMGVVVQFMTLMLLLSFANSDFAQDRAECTEQLVGLSTCLLYVGGGQRAPPPDCCSGLKLVVQKSLKCLCIIVKDRNDPNLGLKVNSTLALGLPSTCHAPVNISQCTELLHLTPNSTDAQLFDGFEKSLENGNTTQHGNAEVNSSDSTPGTSSGLKSSHGGSTKPWLATLHIVNVVLIWLFTPGFIPCQCKMG